MDISCLVCNGDEPKHGLVRGLGDRLQSRNVPPGTSGDLRQSVKGMFVRSDMEEKNKEIIRTFYREFFNEHIVSSADRYVKEDYIQHNPGVEQGREALKQAFRKRFEEDPEFRLDIQIIIAENDMAAVYLKNIDRDGNTNCRVVDIYRFEDGMLAEHWDVLQSCK